MDAPVIRCMSCNTLIGHKWEDFHARVAALKNDDKGAYLVPNQTMSDVGKIMDDLGITRPCCRKHFLVHA